ncbi:hypothetical protein GDO81_000256 [Engystomops pustulosus]|uniref:Uncharacterized protein n=1 Tax=Engystomops pustulosus TaxID=76066 RepID=A0AAV7D600_ENGPU|nr:hypothetical protein GDO81_000256 [Engystomops pustulosus]
MLCNIHCTMHVEVSCRMMFILLGLFIVMFLNLGLFVLSLLCLWKTCPTTPNTPISPTSPTSPVSPLTPGGTPSKHSCRGHHLHTIGGVAEKNVCSRCSNKRWNLMRSPLKPKEPKKSKPGAVTVLSVGRFKVTKVEPKSKERKRLMSDGREVPIVEVPPMPVSVDTRQRSGTETEDRSTVYT